MDKNSVAFACLSLVTAIYLIGSTLQWRTAIRSHEAVYTAVSETEQVASASVGGLFLDNDAYYWIGYARDMAEAGAWRIRHTWVDNTPTGRPVHWSQSIAWLLLLAGFLRHIATGEMLPIAIEQAAIWVNPTLFLVLVISTGYLLFKRLALMPALLWMGNLLTILSVQWAFHPMRPDHQSLHLAFMLTGLLCLILSGLGWTRARAKHEDELALFDLLRPPDQRVARLFFVAAGVLGGLGVWIGATVGGFSLGLFMVGAGLTIHLMPASSSAQSQGGMIYSPSLWRVWAVTGALTSSAFYLIEYAPTFPGMRLEVNHPLYALSWLCGGELLARFAASRTGGRPQNIFVTVPLCFGALLLPALIFFGPPEWHAMRDPFMQRVHLFIDEFRPYSEVFKATPWRSAFNNFGILPLFLLLVPFLFQEKKTTLYEWAALWMAFIPSLAFGALMLWQTRWIENFAACSLLLATITLAILWRHSRSQRLAAWGAYALTVALAGQAVYFWGLQRQDIHAQAFSQNPTPELVSPILQRQCAEKLGALNAQGLFRLMCPPHLTARLQYYGHIPGVPSYYWENRGGLWAATEFFTAMNDEDAQRIARERGITHVILPPTPDIARMFYYLKNGHYSEEGARASLAGRLLSQSEVLPPWLRRDVALERALQPGYRFGDTTLLGSLLVFVVQPSGTFGAASP